MDDPVNGVDPLGLIIFGGAGLAALGGLALAAAGVGGAGLAADGLGAMAGKNKNDPLKATKGAAKGLGLAATVVAPAAAARVVPIAAANPTLLVQGAEAAKRVGDKARAMVKPVVDKVMPHGKTIEKSARIINDVVNPSLPPETKEGKVLVLGKEAGEKVYESFKDLRKRNEKKEDRRTASDWWGR